MIVVIAFGGVFVNVAINNVVVAKAKNQFRSIATLTIIIINHQQIQWYGGKDRNKNICQEERSQTYELRSPQESDRHTKS